MTEHELYAKYLALFNEQETLKADIKQLSEDAAESGIQEKMIARVKKIAAAAARGKDGDMIQAARDLLDTAEQLDLFSLGHDSDHVIKSAA